MYEAGGLGAARVGHRRPAGRSALAVRIGRGHHRTAGRASRTRSAPRLSPTWRAAVADRARSARVRASSEPIEPAIAARCPTLARPMPRVPLGRAITLAEPILERLRAMPRRRVGQPAGSLRRGQDTVGDIEIVAATTSPRTPSPSSSRLPDVVALLHRSDRRLYLLYRSRAGRHPSAGSGQRRRGAAAYRPARPRTSPRCARTPRRRGWRLTSGRPAGRRRHASSVCDRGGDLRRAWPAVHSAGDSRRRRGDRARAKSDALPALLSTSDIRGDLHMHTEFSDGRDPIEAMVQMCRALGYEYMAITDHSPHSAASRNLSLDGVEAAGRRDRRLRERYPEIAILHGCEVDILPDGRLDFHRSRPRAARHRAGVAARARRAARATSCCGATRPRCGIRSSPSSRTRPTGSCRTARLRSRLRRAVRDRSRDRHGRRDRRGAGAPRSRRRARTTRRSPPAPLVAVDSDCHRAEMLERQMELGVTTARRGWVEPRHVLNTRPLAEIRAFIAAKRG